MAFEQYKIVHVTHRYLPGLGGTERLLAGLANRQAAAGHRVTVIAPSTLSDLSLPPAPAGALPAKEKIGQVCVRRFQVAGLPGGPAGYNALRRLLRTISDLPVEQTPALSQALLLIAIRISRLTPSSPDLDSVLSDTIRDADAVHFMNICYEGFGWRALAVARQRRLPFVCTPLIHLGESANSVVRRYYTMRQQIALCRQADHILAATYLESDYLASVGIDQPKITVAGVAIEPDQPAGDGGRFRQRHGLADGPIVVYVGPYQQDKGVYTLVEAAGKLNSAGRSANLVLVGQSNQRFASWLNQKSFARAGWLRLLGQVDDQEKADALAAGSVLALPSRTDSFGLVVLEGWHAGLPAVVARAGGLPAVVEDGVDGLVVEYGNADQLAFALDRLLSDPTLAGRLAANGRQKLAERYNWELVYPKVQAVFDRLVKERRSRR